MDIWIVMMDGWIYYLLYDGEINDFIKCMMYGRIDGWMDDGIWWINHYIMD